MRQHPHDSSSRNRSVPKEPTPVTEDTHYALTLPLTLATPQGVHARLVYHITVLVDWWAYLGGTYLRSASSAVSSRVLARNHHFVHIQWSPDA